jgi:hypothetical protein
VAAVSLEEQSVRKWLREIPRVARRSSFLSAEPVRIAAKGRSPARDLALRVYRVPSSVDPFWNVVWLLLDREKTVGAGALHRTHRGEHQVTHAALAERLRGRGAYPQILRALRRALGTPVASDRERTEGADKAWRRVEATFDDAERVYRLNPRRAGTRRRPRNW